MKKILSLVGGIILCVSITACSQESKSEATMVVRPSEFSEETTSVLELLDEDVMWIVNS